MDFTSPIPAPAFQIDILDGVGVVVSIEIKRLPCDLNYLGFLRLERFTNHIFMIANSKDFSNPNNEYDDKEKYEVFRWRHDASLFQVILHPVRFRHAPWRDSTTENYLTTRPPDHLSLPPNPLNLRDHSLLSTL